MKTIKTISGVILTSLLCVGVLYAATTIGENITTAGNLEVIGNATTTGDSIFEGSLAVGTAFPDDGGYGILPGYIYAVNASFSDSVSAATLAADKAGSLPPYLGRLTAVTGAATNGAGNASVFEVSEVDAASGGNAYGIYAAASDTGSDAGTVYGIYASAAGGTTNYAGYFSGDVTITAAATTTDLTVTNGDDQVGQVLCYLDAGKIGHCTSVVGETGACPCAEN
jgi:hypothetical protein